MAPGGTSSTRAWLDADGYRSASRTDFSGRWLDVEDVTVANDVLRLSLKSGAEQAGQQHHGQCDRPRTGTPHALRLGVGGPGLDQRARAGVSSDEQPTRHVAGWLAEGAGFEPAADITASDRFQGGSDRPLRHPSRSLRDRPRV